MDDLEIDRTLRAALSEDPSPDFVARVRTTLADAPRPSPFAGVWKPVVAVACVAVVAVVINLRQDARLKPSPTGLGPITAGLKASTTTGSRTTAPAAPSVVVPTFRSAKSNRRPTRARAMVPDPQLPEVIIAADD